MTPRDFINSLELSTRGANVLSALGVENIYDFMGLSRMQVMSLKNIGRKTWNEISAIQDEYDRQRREADRQSAMDISDKRSVVLWLPAGRVTIGEEGWPEILRDYPDEQALYYWVRVSGVEVTLNREIHMTLKPEDAD